MSYNKIFENHLQSYLISIGLDNKVVVDYSSYQDYQYQTPLGLVLKKKVKDFNVEDIKAFLINNYQDFYSDIAISGPGFLSVKFNLFKPEKTINNKQKVIVDYCGVNVAKQMHIGHIRSMFIGDYIVRSHENKGDDVIIYNHIGDWGNQFGYLINYILKNNLTHDLSNKKLTEYYKQSNKLNAEDEVFAKESAEVAYLLQNKLDKKITNLWQELVSISMLEADKVFKEFNLKINLSHTQGESFYSDLCKPVLEDLLAKKIATKSEDGSVAVFFENKSPIVLQKSNGNYLYALYDLAAIKWRIENHNPDKIIYVVDNRQSLHFEQVFNIAKQAGYAKDNNHLVHVAFGTILGKDKKPLKTKSGESLYLDDLFAQGKEILLANEKFLEIDSSIKDEILNKTIVGGMKFYDLKFNKTQDYIFDWEHVFNFTGNSAPYIQNALVRIDSIFTKLNKILDSEVSVDFNNNWTSQEKEIIFNLQKNEELIEESLENYSSQMITEHTVKMCQLLHKYYESEKIIGHADEEKKLQLLNVIYNTVLDACDILGIEHYRCNQVLLSKKPKMS